MIAEQFDGTTKQMPDSEIFHLIAEPLDDILQCHHKTACPAVPRSLIMSANRSYLTFYAERWLGNPYQEQFHLF